LHHTARGSENRCRESQTANAQIGRDAGKKKPPQIALRRQVEANLWGRFSAELI
jgi:hypothetical protein